MSRGRIIASQVFDAENTARTILADANAEAQALRDSAQREHAEAMSMVTAMRLAASEDRDPSEVAGEVSEVVGLLIRARVPDLRLGEVVHIERAGSTLLAAEVVGFCGDDATLLPLADMAGLAPHARVWRTGRPLQFECGEALLGRVLDGLGQPIDGGVPLVGTEAWAVDRAAPSPMDRPQITTPLRTGIRAVDGLCTLGEGQRVGLFAGPGVGKSTLLGQLARGVDADVCVVCLVGERGRELRELLATHLGDRRERTIAVCATSDAPSLVRVRAVQVATAIAEWFRERRGARVMLLVDSLTRVARAQREVGLAAGEPPARHGYPPSVFALLPRLVERAGATSSGIITAIYTVLVAGGDLDEPIADEARGLVDAHLVLDRRLAGRGHFPPLDITASVSRLAAQVTTDQHRAAVASVRRRIAVHDEHRDLLTLGAYVPGADAALDDAVAAAPAIERFLRQSPDEAAGWDATCAALTQLAR